MTILEIAAQEVVPSGNASKRYRMDKTVHMWPVSYTNHVQCFVGRCGNYYKVGDWLCFEEIRAFVGLASVRKTRFYMARLQEDPVWKKQRGQIELKEERIRHTGRPCKFWSFKSALDLYSYIHADDMNVFRAEKRQEKAKQLKFRKSARHNKPKTKTKKSITDGRKNKRYAAEVAANLKMEQLAYQALQDRFGDLPEQRTASGKKKPSGSTKGRGRGRSKKPKNKP